MLQSDQLFLIVGLGNPGPEYDGTRHNVGREIADAISRNAECKLQNAEWRERKLLHAEILECDIAGQRVLLAKPTTYMNESGRAVVALMEHVRLYGSTALRLVIAHDDLDLPLGTLRLSQGGSSGGHKGVQSIIDALAASRANTPTLSPSERGGEKEGVGSNGTNFLRLRIGIGPNATPDGHRIPSEKFVLEKFRKEERPLIDTAIARAVEAITILLRDGLPAARDR